MSENGSVAHLIQNIFIQMEEPDEKDSKERLVEAAEHYHKGQFQQSKLLLEDFSNPNICVQLNLLLNEYKINPANCDIVLKAMMNTLTRVDIQLYKNRPLCDKNEKNPIKTIQHEFYYWNIIVLALQLGKPTVATLIAQQALYFYYSFRTETAFMIIYQALQLMLYENRLPSAISLIEKHQEILHGLKAVPAQSRQFHTLINTLYVRTLLKLKMITQSQSIYMLKLGEEDKQHFEAAPIPFQVYQEFMHAEIEFHKGNRKKTLELLHDIQDMTLNLTDRRLKAYLLSNQGITHAIHAKPNLALFYTKQAIQNMQDNNDSTNNTDIVILTQKCKENHFLAMLKSAQESRSPLHAYQQLYAWLKQVTAHSYSYTLNYRKAQACIGYYHSYLKYHERVIAWSETHDDYEPVYYYPNEPYVQHKNKVRNVNYANNKHFYKRYIIPSWQEEEVCELSMERKLSVQENYPFVLKKEENLAENEKGLKKKDKAKGKDKEQKKEGQQEDQPAIKECSEKKFREILLEALKYLKDGLTILEEEKKVVINLRGSEAGFNATVNQQSYTDYFQYKSSILTLLCYVSLTLGFWAEVISYSKKYHEFKQYETHDKEPSEDSIQSDYNVFMYEVEAYSQFNRLKTAYDLVHKHSSTASSERRRVDCISSATQKPGQCYFESSNEQINFNYNMAVLHCRDNRIPQSYNSIEKILNRLRLVPSNPHAKIPLSLIDLLIHYNLRTNNHTSALQLIKRKRILLMHGMVASNGIVSPILNVTK